MREIYNLIDDYQPLNPQEESDKRIFLEWVDKGEEILTRDNKVAHITVSSWVVNKARTKVLMIYHNIYDSWAWMGGHADGDRDLLGVAIKEIGEESGIENIVPLSKDIFSLEILTVEGHEKNGEYVSSHLHLNVTYLFECDENEKLTIKPDENSGVMWMDVDEIGERCNEKWFVDRIYSKLVERAKTFCSIPVKRQ